MQYKRQHIRTMSYEDRREYNRQKARESRLRRFGPKVLKPRPETYACRRCGEIKPFTAEYFYEESKSKWGLLKRCRKCLREVSLENNAATKFGMTRAEYEALVVNRSCAICGTPHRVGLDHCHATGRLRGTLCAACNTGIGLFKDDPDRLLAAARYCKSS